MDRFALRSLLGLITALVVTPLFFAQIPKAWHEFVIVVIAIACLIYWRMRSGDS